MTRHEYNYDKAANENFHKLGEACRLAGVHLVEADKKIFDVHNANGDNVGTLWRLWSNDRPLIGYREGNKPARCFVEMDTATPEDLLRVVVDLMDMGGIVDPSIPW